MRYNFKKIEKKWQKKWEKEKAFLVKEKSGKKKFYCLEMFPYPSSVGLHMGHALNYAIGDVFARFKRMKGFNVLYPMGFDSFGLPAENAAIKASSHPKKFTKQAIKNYIKQQKALGLSYDWSKVLSTSEPEYYKWNQFFFLKFLEKGLVYRKMASVNWCPQCRTVLANEQVHNGKCWRHEDAEVEIKQLKQWFIKTTAYAEELLDCIDGLDWPERIKIMQKNWIGKSFGTEIDFEIPLNKETNFIFLHGLGGSPKTNFFPWLKKEIEGRKYKVSAPELPNMNNPNIQGQIDYVLKNEKIDENTILLGHSLGSLVVLKVIEQLNKPIKKLILVSGQIKPDAEDIGKPHEKTFDWKYNFDKIKNNVKEIVILNDINDELRKRGDAKEIQKVIGGKIINFEAEEEHITARKEPVVLENCIEKWPVFTTRPDTIYGVTFMVVSAQHPKVMELVTKERKKEVEKFLKKVKSVSEKELEELEKEGVFTGSYAVNPLTKEKVPVYSGNFVVADYGSGMVMAVPAHDQRDFEFAKKYSLPVKEVITGGNIKQRAYTGEGTLINSGKFNKMNSKKAIEEITKHLEKKKLGRKFVQYKLKDWLVSRQRYWGTPIPVVYCDKCGIVPEKKLPVVLPEKVKFGEGNPLETNKTFVNAKCPKCKGNAKRETDTMDTFFDSSWYYLRYCDPKNNKKPFDEKKINYWLPVDQYIGGAEHACMHLLYARFFTKALRDLKFVKFDEPFIRLFNQGMLHGHDGEKMSKSKGNIINPDEVSEKYGMDSARFFLLALALPDKSRDWSEEGIQGSSKFLKKILDYFNNVKIEKSNAKTESKLNKTIKEVTEHIENFKYNLAIIEIRNLFNSLPEKTSREVLEKSLKLLHIFCPHITEELWQKIGGKGLISLAKWPVADEKKIDENLEKQEQMIEKLITDINHVARIVRKKASKVFVYVLPNEKQDYPGNLDLIKKKTGLDVEIFAVNDKNKYDPQNKSKKVKPGRPGIYLE